MKDYETTIVIPTLANELTKKAVAIVTKSLRKTCDLKIIFAYNKQEEDSPLEHLGDNVWRFKTKKQGQCHGVNKASEYVDTEWMIVANDDMYFPPGWLEKLLRGAFVKGLLVACPNLVEPTRGAPPFLEKFCGGLGGDWDEQCFLDFVKEYENSGKSESNRSFGLEKGFNFPLLVRKDVWDTVEGYDESYDPWGSNSDSDLQYKFLLAGVHPYRVRDSLVYHFSQTSGTFNQDNESFRHANYRHFRQKWGFERANSPEIWFEPEIPTNQLIYRPPWMGKYK